MAEAPDKMIRFTHHPMQLYELLFGKNKNVWGKLAVAYGQLTVELTKA